MTGAFPWDEPAKDQREPAKLTTITGGKPTQFELEQATEELFQEIYFGHFKGVTNERGIKKDGN